MAKPIRTCSVDGCNDKFHARDFCARHNDKFVRYGTPNGGRDGTRRGALLRWIEENKKHKSDDCLIWPFERTRYGYGTIRLDGVKRVASRVMCEKAHGKPPTDAHVAAHSCGKGHEGCMNPLHLRWATRGENAADAIEHGTAKRGDNDPNAKLTDADVLEIRSLHGKVSHAKLAARFNVGASQISRAATGERWAWLDGKIPAKLKCGELSVHSKLTEKQALEILSMKGERRPVDVSKQYGVASRTIRDIWERKTWRHLPS